MEWRQVSDTYLFRQVRANAGTAYNRETFAIFQRLKESAPGHGTAVKSQATQAHRHFSRFYEDFRSISIKLFSQRDWTGRCSTEDNFFNKMRSLFTFTVTQLNYKSQRFHSKAHFSFETVD